MSATLSAEEMNSRIAKLCGWHDGDGRANWPDFGYGPNSKPYPVEPERLPDYTGSMDAALTMAERLAGEGWRLLLVQHTDNRWVASFANGCDNPLKSWADTPAMAVCLAFLQVMEARG